jgi:hypothetical protein
MERRIPGIAADDKRSLAGPTHQIQPVIFQPQKGAKIRKMKKPEVGDSRFVANYHTSPLEMTLRRADLNTQSRFCALLRLFAAKKI